MLAAGTVEILTVDMFQSLPPDVIVYFVNIIWLIFICHEFKICYI